MMKKKLFETRFGEWRRGLCEGIWRDIYAKMVLKRMAGGRVRELKKGDDVDLVLSEDGMLA